MMAYTIAPALESGVFESVIVSTDSEEIAAIARHYGAEVPFLRPAAFAGDTSPDIEWLEHTLAELRRAGPHVGLFQPAASDEPVPHRGDDSPRLDDVHVAGRASIRCARSRSARSIRARCGWCAAIGCVRCCRSGSGAGRAAVAQHAVSGAAAGLRAERVARDRLDARRVRERGRSPATCSCRSSPKATRASTSTMPLTGWWPSGCSPTATAALPRAGHARAVWDSEASDHG